MGLQRKTPAVRRQPGTPSESGLLVLTSLPSSSSRRAAHSLAERGAGRHLLWEDERDLAPSTRLLAPGGNCGVSLRAVAREMTPTVFIYGDLFSFFFFLTGSQTASVISQQTSQNDPYELNSDGERDLVQVAPFITVVKDILIILNS